MALQHDVNLTLCNIKCASLYSSACSIATGHNNIKNQSTLRKKNITRETKQKSAATQQNVQMTTLQINHLQLNK